MDRDLILLASWLVFTFIIGRESNLIVSRPIRPETRSSTEERSSEGWLENVLEWGYTTFGTERYAGHSYLEITLKAKEHRVQRCVSTATDSFLLQTAWTHTVVLCSLVVWQQESYRCKQDCICQTNIEILYYTMVYEGWAKKSCLNSITFFIIHQHHFIFIDQVLRQIQYVGD